VRSYVVRESVWGREREGERVCAEEDEDRGRAIEYVQAIPVASQTPRSKVASRFGFFFCLSLLWIFFVECEEGVLVKMCIVDKLDGGWCIGGFQEQICSPVK
jgi:hypothetical protein